MARPLGSTTRPQLKDFVSVKERERLIQKAIDKAVEGDPIMLKFLLEQIYGRAVQPVSNDGDTFKVQVIPILNNALLSDNQSTENISTT